jgi:hypothetical protein
MAMRLAPRLQRHRAQIVGVTTPSRQLVRMFPDIRVHIPYPIQFGDGDWTTLVTNATGTFTGGMTLPDGNVISPTGKAFRR